MGALALIVVGHVIQRQSHGRRNPAPPAQALGLAQVQALQCCRRRAVYVAVEDIAVQLVGPGNDLQEHGQVFGMATQWAGSKVPSDGHGIRLPQAAFVQGEMPGQWHQPP